MLFVEKPPYFGCPSGKAGLPGSMFTNTDYRRKSIAKGLLSRVVNDAKEYGCGTVQITASDMGVSYIQALGLCIMETLCSINIVGMKNRKYGNYGSESSYCISGFYIYNGKKGFRKVGDKRFDRILSKTCKKKGV